MLGFVTKHRLISPGSMGGDAACCVSTCPSKEQIARMTKTNRQQE